MSGRLAGVWLGITGLAGWSLFCLVVGLNIGAGDVPGLVIVWLAVSALMVVGILRSRLR